MLIEIEGLLSAEEVDEVRRQLLAQPWVDGKVTAGVQSAQVKANRQLDEEYMLIKVAEPFIMQTLTDQFFAQLNRQELARTAIDWRNIAVRTPRQLDDILTQLNAGRLRFEWQMLGMPELQRTLAVIGNKISFSLLISSMIMGAAIVMSAPKQPTFNGFPILSLIIFTVSAVLALWLIISIMRSGTLRQ